jgi:hypothetical protein
MPCMGQRKKCLPTDCLFSYTNFQQIADCLYGVHNLRKGHSLHEEQGSYEET